jgi:predicted ATPase/class 3 adenylate cyclase
VAWPTGTVTFLFTDIEGSTRLAHDLGGRWPAILDRHRRIIRGALLANGGIEVQTEGDGFFAVFLAAPAAVAAVARAQLDLAAEPWPPGAGIRVRMGLHAGEGIVDADGSYVGHDIHRAARIAAAGHGGQVLVSDAVRALAETSLPAVASLRDLGEHRLKDLRPERLWQVVLDDLPADFPPLRSLDARPNNLPAQLTTFVGRDRELAEAAALLATARLLTLSGPGGTGKTRLALQLAASVADDFPDGIWFVPLEPLRDAELVMPTVARTLGVFQRPGETAIDALTVGIGDRRMLLVLDNFEHLVGAASDVGELLRACPAVHVVTTSRAVLRIAGEQEYVVPGLPAPPDTSRLSRVEIENLPSAVRHPDPATLSQYEAVRLFIARAVAVRPDFRVTNENAPAVAGICARLGGMPLAIELAAARVKLLSPIQILERLEHQLSLLTSSARDLPERQRTLRGAIAWSCDLLDEPHRRLMARLSVFRGGWQLEAAEAVAGASGGPVTDVLDGLADLADQSLVRAFDAPDGAPRFDMFESIREYAEEHLAAAGDTDAARAAHAAVYLDLAEEMAPLLQGAEQRRHLDRLELDHDNLREAIGWAIDRPDPPTAVRLAFALWRFWQQRGYLVEARQLLEGMAARDWVLPARLRARFAETIGGIAYWQADLPATVAWYDQALAIWREIATPGTEDDRRELANALYNRAYASVAEVMDDPRMLEAHPDVTARTQMEEALAIYRELGDTAGEGNLLWGLGGYAMFTGGMAEAEGFLRQAIELHRATGHRTMEAWSLHMLSSTLVVQERVAEAGEASRHALRHFDDARDVAGITLALDVLSAVALASGDLPRGGRLWGAARQLQRVSGTGLAAWDERVLAMMPHGVSKVLALDERDRLAAEGGELALADAVAYAMGESDPFVERAPG